MHDCLICNLEITIPAIQFTSLVDNGGERIKVLSRVRILGHVSAGGSSSKLTCLLSVKHQSRQER